MAILSEAFKPDNFELHNSLKAFIRYFSLFLKEKCISSSFRTKYIEKKFNLQLFFLPSVHEHLFSPGLPRATRLLETSCLENGMCNRDNARDVAVCPDE